MSRIVHHIVTLAIAGATLIASVAAGLAQAAPQPAQAAKANPALWVLHGPKSTVYLFGTVHILKKDLDWQTPKIQAALADSKELWLEIPDVDNQEAMKPLVQKYGVDAEHPLSTKLSKDQLAHLDSIAKKAGIPAGEAAFEPYRPWMAGLTLGLLPMLQAGYDPNSGVEFTIKPLFTKANKPVHGFETAEQQLRFFADLPQKQEVDFLDESLDEVDEGLAKFDQIAAAWAAGDVEAIDKQLDAEMRDKYPDVYKLLLVQRNKAWIPQIQTLLKGEGTYFVAVGAGHLAGPDGVPTLLTAAGVKVDRIE